MAKLAPSILSADFSKLGEEVKKIEKGGASLIHIDVMDGHFVPNISFGPDVMKSLNGVTNLPYDVHLMIENPEEYIPEFSTKNTEYITVHQEAYSQEKTFESEKMSPEIGIINAIDLIHQLGIKAGLSINPETDVASLISMPRILEKIDLILVMSVHPGFGGQRYIELSENKVRTLKEERIKNNYGYLIEVDGGINLENVLQVVNSGADIIVVGSAIFKSDDVVNRTKAFVDIIK